MATFRNNKTQTPQQVNDVRQHDQSGISAQTLEELQRIQNIYLELMQSCLTGSIYRDRSHAPFGSNTFNLQKREYGLDWPSQALTMIGVKRLANLRALTESVIAENVPGDLIETGVWRGGACILMRAVLFAHNVTDKYVWVADSFEGLPPANELQYPADVGSDYHKYDELTVTLEQVQENFRTYGLFDEQTKFLKGWFKDTLPTAPIGQLALMRLDGDMYESTMDAMTSLYPKLSPRGYVIIDDYNVVPACKAAVNDYCSANGMQPKIVDIDGVGIYWRKPAEAECDGEIIRQNQTVRSPDLQIARLNQALAELNRRAITQLTRSIDNRDEQIAGLNLSIADRDKQIARLKLQIAGLNQQIAGIMSSTSWRMTKPIRAIGAFLRNLRRSLPTARR